MKQYVLMAALFASTGYASGQDHQAINLSYMDQSVRPQDDFYNFVNGNWMKTVEIPSDKARWGSFDELRENTDEATLKILKESLSTEFEKGSDGQKIADLYKTYVDFDTRDELGIQPIVQQLDDIDQVSDLSQLYDYFVKYGAVGGNPFFGAYVYAHMKNSNMNAVYLGGGGLGLGRTYYQKEDERNTETLADYQQYINALYGTVKPKTRDLKGPKVVAFEKLIASHLKTVEEMRDAQKRYNPIAVKDLGAMVKNMDVAKYIQTLGFRADTVIVGELTYYENLDKILNEENLPVIKEYLKFHVMDDATSYLTRELDELSFEFYGKKLRGQQEQRALDKRGLEFVNGNVGELLGKLYVKQHFPAEAKETCEELVSYLVKSFDTHI
ncbi:MAG: M13 family peptidase, partial [Sphingobacterium sp.]